MCVCVVNLETRFKRIYKCINICVLWPMHFVLVAAFHLPSAECKYLWLIDIVQKLHFAFASICRFAKRKMKITRACRAILPSSENVAHFPGHFCHRFSVACHLCNRYSPIKQALPVCLFDFFLCQILGWVSLLWLFVSSCPPTCCSRIFWGFEAFWTKAEDSHPSPPNHASHVFRFPPKNPQMQFENGSQGCWPWH